MEEGICKHQHRCSHHPTGLQLTGPSLRTTPAVQDKGAIQAAKKRAEELGARVEYASKHDLNMVADNRPHQVCLCADRWGGLCCCSCAEGCS